MRQKLTHREQRGIKRGHFLDDGLKKGFKIKEEEVTKSWYGAYAILMSDDKDNLNNCEIS